MTTTLVRRATEGLHQEPLTGRTTNVLDDSAVENLVRTVRSWEPTEVAGELVRQSEVQFELHDFDVVGLNLLRLMDSGPGAAAGPGGEADERPGAPSTGVLLAAVRDLRQWTTLTQAQLCEYLGISRSTVMMWKREQTAHPRHGQIPTLVRLWAALAAARDEFGDEAGSRLFWQTASRGADQLPSLPAEELAERMLTLADEASRAAFDDSYDVHGAVPAAIEDLEAGELELREQQSAPVEDTGLTDRE